MKKWVSVALACVMALGCVFGAVACGDKNDETPGNQNEQGGTGNEGGTGNQGNTGNEGGSGDEQKQLAAPEGLTLSTGGLLMWNAVPNATEYVVTVNESSVTVQEPEYTVAADLLKEDFTYSVYARAEGYLDSEKVTKNYLAANVKVTIELNGSSDGTELYAGTEMELKATVTGSSDTSVVWSVTEGAEYVTLTQNGKLTVKNVDSNHTVKIRATSNARPSRYAEKTYTIVARTKLTQEMLDAIPDQATAEFSGHVDVDIYTIGTVSRLDRQTSFNVLTMMEQDHWYAEYDDANGTEQALHFVNHENLAQQVGLSLMNEEEYYPLEDEDGNTVTWEASGLYNSFYGFTMDDFTFDEDLWRWKYVGDKTKIEHLIAASNPYEFVAKNLYLEIIGSSVVGFYAESESDLKLIPGYRSEMKLTVLINYEDVEVPQIIKFEHMNMHDALQEAIDNMTKLDSFKTTIYNAQANLMGGGMNYTGYEEIVTEDVAFYRDFDYSDSQGTTMRHTYTGAGYGFKRVEGNLFNTFNNNGGDAPYHAYRAVEAADGANPGRPAFRFAAELFGLKEAENLTDGSPVDVYYAYPTVAALAKELYGATTNEDALYGIYATSDVFGQTFTPYLAVKDGYVVEAGFAYNLGGLIYGTMTVKFSDFDSAALPADLDLNFATRAVPTQWSQLTTEDDQDTPTTSDDTIVPCDEFFADFFGDSDHDVPFFGEVLGDTFGFAMTSSASYRPLGGNRYVEILLLYYDVPLDRNYSINESLAAVSQWLEDEGYTQNAYGEFYKDNLGILLVDNAGDFLIYVWAVEPEPQPAPTEPAE